MKKIAVIPNVNKDQDLVVTNAVIKKLVSLNLDVFVRVDIKVDRDGVTLYNDFPEEIDLAIVVGGDGSVIDASMLAIEKNIPILGVNLGKVGYLTEVEVDGLNVLDNLVSGEYFIAEKMLLSVDFENESHSCDRYAVNDVTISRDGFLHIANIKIEDSIGNAVKLRSDGVILSTPQGSTAYSFSSGGPIVAHDVESILLTPISSHSFFNRSVIFNSSDVIKVTNMGEPSLNVSVDGRFVSVLSSGETCEITKASKTFKILTFTKNSMFSSLFKKMRILGDIE